MRRRQLVGHTAVEPLDHPIGLWLPRLDEPVLDPMLAAHLVEQVAPRGLSLALRGETVRELAPVVRQDRADLHGRSLEEALQERGSVPGRFGGPDLKVHPPGGAVDGDEEVLVHLLVRHLRQMLDVDVDVARLVRLELLGLLPFNLRHQVLQRADAVALEAAVQRRPGELGLDELADDGQQVVDRQEQRAPQFDDDRLLGRREGRPQVVRRVGAILDGIALAPPRDRGVGHAVPAGELRVGDRGRSGPDLGTDPRGGGGVLVQADVHVWAVAACGASPRRRSTRRGNSEDSHCLAAKMRASLPILQSSGTKQVDSSVAGWSGAGKVPRALPRNDSLSRFFWGSSLSRAVCGRGVGGEGPQLKPRRAAQPRRGACRFRCGGFSRSRLGACSIRRTLTPYPSRIILGPFGL